MSGDGGAPGPVDGRRGQGLWSRADAVLPGGNVYFSRSARFGGDGNLPGFIERADGCRVTDVDGRTYLDFNCGNGPNLLGYLHPEVEAAAREQAGRASLASFFPPALVELSERLLAAVPGYDFAVPVKAGSDATALAARILRAATERPLLLVFSNAYHGLSPEFIARPGQGWDTSNLVRVPWNDAEAVHDVVRRSAERLAGVLLNPLDQNPRRPTREPSSEFLAAVETVRSVAGGFIAFDDVRHGFRLHPQGSHRNLGMDPDLTCLGKALGNGHSVAALLGVEALREPCSRLMLTSTYIFDPVAFRAAVTTLDVYQRDDVFTKISAAGERLRKGLLHAAEETGHRVDVSGPVTMPTLLFADDEGADRSQRFAREAAHLGAIFHPSLNWFLCLAHDEAVVDEAIEIARSAFERTPVG
ncbi:MAG: aminotransferase class III-fold pyridoxal phosphate-dependent enzyme [Acidobacteriota bacterium]